MKALLAKLFNRRAEAAPAPTPSKPAGKRQYGKGKRHHSAPRGARKIDPNGPLIEQARQAGGIKQ